MAHNDEAGGSGGKGFWELSQEMEEQPHLYEAAAFPPILRPRMVPPRMTTLMPPLMVPPRMPPLMMAAPAQWQPTEEATEGPAPDRAPHPQGGSY